MATIEIGGRKLEVAKPTLGFMKKRRLPWLKSFDPATTDEAGAIDHTVEGLFLYLGHNEGVTREWLEENATAETLPEVMRLSHPGAAPAAPGEAARP